MNKFGDKTLSMMIPASENNKSINQRSYEKINIPYFVSFTEYKHLRENERLTHAQVMQRVGFPGSLTSFRRRVNELGWDKPLKPYTCCESFFRRDSRASAWVLGWMVTDGFISERYIKLDLQKSDHDILEKIKRHIEFEGNIYESKLCKGLKIHSKPLVESLVSRGIPLKNKTFECRFPKFEPAYTRDFLRGAFEGDGSISTRGAGLNVNICGASERFMRGIEGVLTEQGVRLRIENRDNNFKVLTAATQADALRWLLFMYRDTDASTRMDRKFNKFVDFVRTYYDRPRKSVEAAEIIEHICRTIPECATTPNVVAAA